MTGARVGRIVLVAAIAGAIGCFSPSASSGLPCSPEGRCPTGQVCDDRPAIPVCVDMIGSVDGAVADAAPGTPDATPIGCGGPGDCPASTPVCDLFASTCRVCVADTECASDACREYEGTCAAESETLYVASGGGGSTCTRAAPCGGVAAALAAATASRAMIKIGDGAYAGVAFTFDLPVPIVLSGPDQDWVGVTISPSSTGILVRNNASVLIEGVLIVNALSDGINQQTGTLILERVEIEDSSQANVDMTNGTLRVRDSRIERSGANGLYVNGGVLDVARTTLRDNSNGGLSATGTLVTVVDSMFTGNGVAGGNTPAAHLVSASVGSRLVHNTFANNSGGVEAGGVECDGLSVEVVSTIFFGNGATQADAACLVSYSLFDSALVAGTGNILGNPMFVDAPNNNFHITASSPARGAGDPGSTEPVDFDREQRPQPQGTTRDIGADEVP